MKFFKLYLVLTVFSLSASFGSPAFAKICTADDYDYASFWDNYYDPEEAYNFGIKIQSLVRDKDMNGIFQLIDGELSNGPRRNFALGKTFDEIFSPSWVEAVLLSEPSCSPVGWRGFMLGRGDIWFNKFGEIWNIFSINGATAEVLPLKQVGWYVDQRLLHPRCFVRPWMSGDNFEEFADQFGIVDYTTFFREPGKFLGDKVDDFNEITPNWCDSDDCEKISLIKKIDECAPMAFEFEERDNAIYLSDENDGYEITYSYSVLGKVNFQNCSELAPELSARCMDSFLIEVGDYSGGSMGWYLTVGIYGIFDIQNLGPSVVPLKYFSSVNEALNYIENF